MEYGIVIVTKSTHMKTIFAAVAVALGLTASAQSEPGFGLPVLQKGPNVEKVIELSRDRDSQTGLLRIEFQSDKYPVYFLFHGDTLGIAMEPGVRTMELPVRYTLTENATRQYDMHVANTVGSVYIGTMELSLPSVADALK